MRFWERLFSAPDAYGLQLQAIEDGFLRPGACLEDGRCALAVWLQAQAQRRYDEDGERARKSGLKNNPRQSPWELRSVYSVQETGWFSEAALAVLQALVRQGANVMSEVPEAGVPSIELGFRLNEPEAVRLMLTSSVAPDPAFFMEPRLPAEKGVRVSLLDWAASCQDPRYLEALRDHGVPLDGIDEKGRSLLFRARNAKVASCLVAAGLSTSRLDKKGTSVMAQWMRQVSCSTLVNPGPVLEGDLAWTAGALCRGVPAYVDSNEAARLSNLLVSGAETVLLAHGLTLPQVTVADGKGWKAKWPLPVFFAKESLASAGGMQSIRPLVDLGAKQGWLQQLDQETVRGARDRGWLALACWRELSRSHYSRSAVLLERAGKALRMGTDWWLDPGVVAEAGRLTRNLIKRSPYRSALGAAWGNWLVEAKALPVDRLPWKEALVALEMCALLNPQTAVVKARQWHADWSGDDHKPWVRLAVGLLGQSPGRGLLEQVWPEGWKWPVEGDLSDDDEKFLKTVAFHLPREALGISRLVSENRQRVLNQVLLDPPSVARHRARL